MRKKFVTNLALLLFLNLLVKPFWIFGVERTVQNIVGAADYGLYFSLLNFSLILNILLDLGITNYNNRNIAQHNQLLSKYLSNIVVLKFFLAFVYAIVSIIIAVVIGWDWKHFNLLFFLIFNQILISFTLYLRSNLSGLHLFKTDSFISVLDRTLMTIICAVLLWGNVTQKEFQIEWLIYAQTVAYGLTAIITFFTVLAKAEFLKLRFDRSFFIVILKQSFPYALLILLMSFYNRIDSVMLERLLPNGEQQAGIYAQAFRILDAASMFALLFAGLLLPIFAKMIKQKEAVGQLAQFSFLLLIVPATILAMTSYFYNTEIMDLMYFEHVEQSSVILSVLMFGFMAISTTYIFGTLLTANGSLKQLNIMAAGGMLLNIVLNLILIPKYMAFGSAIASLVTQTFTALAQVLIAGKVFSFKINYKLIAVLFLFIVGVWGIGFISKELFKNWHVGVFTMIGASALLAFGVKLIDLKTLYQVIKNDDSFNQS